MAANADLQEGDLLATSGVDGVYPPGLPVAKIERIERRADSGFARIYCLPLAQVTAARYVLVLAPIGSAASMRSAAAASAAASAASVKKNADAKPKAPAASEPKPAARREGRTP
jgi:rod shape-determining protein MreC